MIRRVDNPPNPFARAVLDRAEPAPAARLRVFEEHAASILTRNNSPDVPYEWSVNPYRGCSHACAYCYARRTHEYLDLGAGTDFEHQLFAKLNAPALLSQEIGRANWDRQMIAFSGVTDCYQPIEAQYRLTRQCLEICLARANPVGVVTKSALVVRDAALLAELHQRADAHVFMTITFADDALARKVEPRAAPPSLRFDALRRLRRAGVPAGVLIAPVVPGLNDREIPEILRQSAAVGAIGARYAPLRLPGHVADVFLQRMRAVVPERANRVEALVRDLRGGRLNDPRRGCRMRAEGAYWESTRRLFETFVRRYRLDLDQPEHHAYEPPRRPKQMRLFE